MKSLFPEICVASLRTDDDNDDPLFCQLSNSLLGLSLDQIDGCCLQSDCSTNMNS